MLALIVGTTLMLATFFLAPLVTTPLFGEPTTELFRLLSPTFVIAAVGIVPLAMLERQLDFRRISMIEIAGVLVGALTSVGLALPGLNAEAYVLGVLAGMVVWAGLLVVFGPSRAAALASAADARDRGIRAPGRGSPAWRWSATGTSTT